MSDWIVCACCGKRENWDDFTAPELRCQRSSGVDWRKEEPQKRAKWEDAYRVLRRVEQCRQMIAAHKATAERIRKSEVRRFEGYAYDDGGLVRLRYTLTNPMRPDERRAIQTYHNALSHVAAAYRYLGVKL